MKHKKKETLISKTMKDETIKTKESSYVAPDVTEISLASNTQGKPGYVVPETDDTNGPS